MSDELKIRAAIIGAAFTDGTLSVEESRLLSKSEDGLTVDGFVFRAIEAVALTDEDEDETWIEGWDPVTDRRVIVSITTSEEVRPIERTKSTLVARPVAVSGGESFAIEGDGHIVGYVSRSVRATTWTLTTSNGLPLGYSPTTLTDAITHIGEWVEFVECVLNNLEDE